MKCIVNDGMQEIYAKLEKTDLFVIGNPIYWFGPTAKTKLFLDRLRPYYGNKQLKDKKAALILPAGGGAGDCDLTIEMFKRSFDALGIDFLGVVTAESYDIGDAKNDHQAMLEVSKLAEIIDRSISKFRLGFLAADTIGPRVFFLHSNLFQYHCFYTM